MNIYFFVMALCSTQYYVSSKETWQKIKANGYPFMMYEYQSKDNFMLGMERIPYSKHGNKTIGKPVILLSGMFATSIMFVSHNLSLGYQLSDAGFDVWLYNYRVAGMSKNVKDPRTGLVPRLADLNWDFCFQEMGIYDLPAAIDLVIAVTGYSKVDIGGLSLGATLPLITLAEKPEYNAKIRNLFLMAPATKMGSRFQSFQYLFTKRIIRKMLKTDFKSPYVLLNSDPDNIPFGELCRTKIVGVFCTQLMNIVQGINNPLHRESVIDVFSTYPQPISVKAIKHFFQLLIGDHFSDYDYGSKGNLAHYGSVIVPEYNISKITAPTIILYSKKDNLVSPKDIQWLLQNLPNIKDTMYIEKVPFSHQSFLMDKKAHTIIVPFIVEQLSRES